MTLYVEFVYHVQAVILKHVQHATNLNVYPVSADICLIHILISVQ